MSSGAGESSLTYDDIRHYFGNYDKEVNLSPNNELRKIILKEKRTALVGAPSLSDKSD